jgi:hypothetical protein
MVPFHRIKDEHPTGEPFGRLKKGVQAFPSRPGLSVAIFLFVEECN